MQQWYLMYHVKGPWYDFLVIPLRFELLCSIMIPISIKVCCYIDFLFPLPALLVPKYILKVYILLYCNSYQS
jgi:hypothetical protein